MVYSVVTTVVGLLDVCAVMASDVASEVASLENSVVPVTVVFEVGSDVAWDENCDVNSDVGWVEASDVAKGVAAVDATGCITNNIYNNLCVKEYISPTIRVKCLKA